MAEHLSNTICIHVTKFKVIQGDHLLISFICTKSGKVTLFFTHSRRFAPCSICLNWCLFTLLGAWVGVEAGTGNGTATIGDNGSWLLPLSQTSVKHFCIIYHDPSISVLVLVPVPIQRECAIKLKQPSLIIPTLRQKHCLFTTVYYQYFPHIPVWIFKGASFARQRRGELSFSRASE